MREAGLEAAALRHVRALGGDMLKLTFRRGLFDRIVLLPHGVVGFCEFKSPETGGRTSGAQLFHEARFKQIGFPTLRTNSLDEFIDWVDNLQITTSRW